MVRSGTKNDCLLCDTKFRLYLEQLQKRENERLNERIEKFICLWICNNSSTNLSFFPILQRSEGGSCIFLWAKHGRLWVLREWFAESRFARKNLQESPFEVRKIRDMLNSESLKR